MSKKSKTTVSANSRVDLHLALTWAKANDAINVIPNIKKSAKGYTASVHSKISRDALKNLLKDKFGVFIRVG